jgi:hypothetical protein
MLSRSGGDGDVPRAVGAHSRQPRGIANAELLTVLSTGADVCSAAVRDRAGGRRDRQGRDEASNPAEVQQREPVPIRASSVRPCPPSYAVAARRLYERVEEE